MFPTEISISLMLVSDTINMEHAILKIQLIKSMNQVPPINDNVI